MPFPQQTYPSVGRNFCRDALEHEPGIGVFRVQEHALVSQRFPEGLYRKVLGSDCQPGA